MPTRKINGYVEVLFTIEVEVDSEDDEGYEEAYEFFEQEKLDAVEITGMQHLTLFDKEGR